MSQISVVSGRKKEPKPPQAKPLKPQKDFKDLKNLVGSLLGGPKKGSLPRELGSEQGATDY